MFGYVRIHKPELKMAEYDQYKGVYCSLCKKLGKQYGFFARMTLSYDFTFLALLCMALDDECTGFHSGRCTFNPLKKTPCCVDSPHLEYAADAAMLMVYYKVIDDIRDKSFFKGLPARLMALPAKAAWKKAYKRQPAMDAVFRKAIQRQAELESAKTPSVDAAAEPTALMLSFLARENAKNEPERRVLERFGYCLGRWVYLIDAADDMPEDEKQGSYNPFLLSHKSRDEVNQTLNACLAECKASYNLLNIRRFDGILCNVLELGMPAVQRQVLSEKETNHDSQ